MLSVAKFAIPGDQHFAILRVEEVTDWDGAEKSSKFNIISYSAYLDFDSFSKDMRELDSKGIRFKAIHVDRSYEVKKIVSEISGVKI